MNVRAHLRRYWHVHTGIVCLLVAAIVAVLGASAPAIYKTVHGQKLNTTGQKLYSHLVEKHWEAGQRKGSETPPPAVAARIARLNATLPVLAPKTLATPEPITFTALVRNQSSRNGATPKVWIVHDAEMPSAPQLQGLKAIAAWFNNVSAQASSNYSTDAYGNTVLMVPTTAKAWTQAFFNPWAISDELLGYASQKTWPEVQLRAAALLAASDMLHYGIPIQHGAVSGCTITRPGILQHSDLGQCGGGHHDAGPNFPIAHFIALVHQYADALARPVVVKHPKPTPHPKPKPRPKPAPRCTVRQVQAALNRHGARLVVDGIEGPRTRAALARVGAAHLGLPCRA